MSRDDARVPEGAITYELHAEYEDGDYTGQVLVKLVGGVEMGRWWDHGEPEDNTFGRDWSWVPDELNGLARDLAALRVENEELRREVGRLSRQAEQYQLWWEGTQRQHEETKRHRQKLIDEADAENERLRNIIRKSSPIQERDTALEALRRVASFCLNAHDRESSAMRLVAESMQQIARQAIERVEERDDG